MTVNTTTINLLPATLRRRLAVRRGLRQWAVRWGLVALFAIGTWAVAWSETRKLQADVDASELDSGGIRRLKNIGQTFDDQITRLEAKRRTLLAVADNRAALATLAVVGRAAKDVGGSVQIDDFSYRESRTSTGGSRTLNARRITVDLAGVAENYSAVGRFVAALEKSGVFARVHLQSSRDTAAGAGKRRHFRLQCLLIRKDES